MSVKLKVVLRILLVLFLFLFGLPGCSDPIPPEFSYKEGLVYMDALASTAPGASYVAVTRSAREFGSNKNSFISGASVSFVNSTTGQNVDLHEQGEVYLPPEDFSAAIGETWELKVVLEDGTEYRSQPETIREPVAISGLDVTYDPELLFNEAEGFVPGHSVSVSFNDPGNEDNYYYWRYRTFEKLINCRVCTSSILREGECTVVDPKDGGPRILPYYTYSCEENCWMIRYGDKISIFSDEFSNGAMTSKLPVADILLFTKRNILVELQQFHLTPEAYRYYKTLKDIIDNNSGFNAPLPAALVGNLFNSSDADEFVLGRFTAASTSVRPIFIERIFIEENQLEDLLKTQPEGMEAPAVQVFTAPCQENRFRTSREPEGWID